MDYTTTVKCKCGKSTFRVALTTEERRHGIKPRYCSKCEKRRGLEIKKQNQWKPDPSTKGGESQWGKCRKIPKHKEPEAKHGIDAAHSAEIERLILQGLPLASIASRFGVTRTAVYEFAVQSGLLKAKKATTTTIKRSKAVTNEERESKAIELLKSGEGVRRVSICCGLKKEKVQRLKDQLKGDRPDIAEPPAPNLAKAFKSGKQARAVTFNAGDPELTRMQFVMLLLMEELEASNTPGKCAELKQAMMAVVGAM